MVESERVSLSVIRKTHLHVHTSSMFYGK